MKKQLTTFAVLFTFLSQSVYASPFRIVGSRAIGMGGAHVAAADGPDAQYWNPGALGLTHGSGFEIPISASFEATGDLLEKADAISKAAEKLKTAQDAQTNGTGLNLTQVQDTADALNKILDLNSTGVGALIDASGGLQTRFGRLAVSFNQYADVGMLPIVDPSLSLGTVNGAAGVSLNGDGALTDGALTAQRDALAATITDLNTGLQLGLNASAQDVANKLINDAQGAGLTNQQISDLVTNVDSLTGTLLPRLTGSGDLGTNRTRVNLTGASLSEVALGYGHTVPFPTKWGALSVGGNLKAIRGQVGFARIFMVEGEDTSISDSIDDARTTTKTTIQPAVDAGVLYRLPFKHLTQFGLVGKNLNSPKFDVPETRKEEGLGKYKEGAQVRAGLAFCPLKRWMLTADVDVTRNETSIPGFDSQLWGVGTEFKIWLLDLRAGLMKNFGENTPVAYTAGFGLNFGALKINAGGAMSSKTVKLETDGTAVPASAQAGLSISLVFGQSQLDKKVVHEQPAIPEETSATPAEIAPVVPDAQPVVTPAATPEVVPVSTPVSKPVSKPTPKRSTPKKKK